MGSSQSSHASANKPKGKKPFGRSVRGRKSTPAVIVDEAPVLVSKSEGIEAAAAVEEKVQVVVEQEPSPMEEITDDESSFIDSSDDEDEEEEEDEFFVERLRVLQDARNLKKLANAFLHPEAPVKVDGTAMGRNYYHRFSAPDAAAQDERAQILAEAAALRKLASDYAHPELGVVTSDACACGRNYFDRASAIPQESVEEAEERALVLADAAALKKAAIGYLHPEVGVQESSPAVFGRNYFDRASAPEQESEEDAEERAQILADAAALKKQAIMYAHPELPVEVDSTATARSYFSRASAPQQESEEDAEERAQILAEAAALKRQATMYAHPELPVEVDSTATARSYFSRASAPQQESEEDAEERAQILAEAAALKKQAMTFAHPELPVEVDSTATARSYFSRASAPQQESEEDAEERAQILAEAASLKKQAIMYAHPELPVEADSTATARNYFSRASAAQQESEEDAEERAQILAEAAALKKQATMYAHPELPVEVDSTATARSYFSRASAPQQESEEDAEERAQILAEAAALKKQAIMYAHPELPVEVGSTATARSYFSRASAPQQESEEDAEERAQILAEAAALKKQAIMYSHPELPVEVDSTATARNYFSRASASEQESEEDAEERAQILAEAAALKKQAVNFAHPEVGVTNVDPTSFGRNYFTRASAPVQEESAVDAPDVATAMQSSEQADEYDHFVPEEQLESLRDELKEKNQPTAADKNRKLGAESGSEEGELSRSPSSVMLFGYEDNQAF